MQGTGMIVMIFLARLLEPSDFGLIAMIMVIIGIASVFSDIGLGGALIQRRWILPIHYSSVFFFNLGVATLLTLLVYFCAPWIGDFYHNPALISITQVMSFSFIIGAFYSVQNTKLQKELNYKLIAKMTVISSILSGIIGVSFAFYGAGVWSLVAQMLSQGIAYNLLIWSSSHWRPELRFSFKALFQLWGFGFRMFLSGLLDAIFSRLDYMLIGKLFSPATLGFFNQAKSLNLFVIRYSSGSLMAVLFPVLSKIQNDLPRFQQVTMKAYHLIAFVVFLLLGGVYITSHELIILLFGMKWEASVYYFKILALSGFSYPLSALLVNVLSGRGNSKAFLRLELYKKTLLLLNLLVLYFYGLDFYLYGLILVSILAVSLNIGFAAKEIHLPFVSFVFPVIMQSFIAIISVFMITYGTSPLHVPMIVMFVLQGSLFVFCYVGLSWILQTKAYNSVLTQIQSYFKKGVVIHDTKN